MPRATTTSTTTPDPAELALETLQTQLEGLGSTQEGSSTADRAQDQALQLAEEALASSEQKASTLEKQLKLANDLVAKQKVQLDAAAAQTEANRANIAAVLERMGVTDFSSVPGPSPPKTPEQCGSGADGDGGGGNSAPQISANGGDINIDACGGAIQLVSKACGVADVCSLQTDLNNVKAMLGLYD